MLDLNHWNDTAPVDARGLAAAAAGQRAHLDEWIARRLYVRMTHRPTLFRRPVPEGVRKHIARLLRRDGLALSVLTSSSRGRLASLAVITSPRFSWPAERLRIEGMQPMHYCVYWGNPDPGAGPRRGPRSVHHHKGLKMSYSSCDVHSDIDEALAAAGFELTGDDVQGWRWQQPGQDRPSLGERTESRALATAEAVRAVLLGIEVLHSAAERVVQRWEHGDLAEAVRELDAALRTLKID